MDFLRTLFGGGKDASAPFGPPVGVDAAIVAFGTDLLQRARRHETGLLSARFYSDRLIDWAMKSQPFRTQLFRFVDVFPLLKSPESIHQHLMEYLLQPGLGSPPGFDLGLKAGGMAKGLVAGAMARQITAMAEQFIASAQVKDGLPILRKRWDADIAYSLDLLGEAAVTDDEADGYMQRYLRAIAELATGCKEWPLKARLEQDSLGPIPRINVSVKLSSLVPCITPLAADRGMTALSRRLTPVLEKAATVGAFVNFDIESFQTKDFVLRAFEHFSDAFPSLAMGIAIQAYLRCGEADARRLIDFARRRKRVITIRLVKGAYWDHETILAEQNGWPCPVWPTKVQTDACFERMAVQLVDAYPKSLTEGGVRLAVGSHNVRSIAAVMVDLQESKLPRNAVEVQMLFGMADPLKAAVQEMGLRLREYVPFGELVPGMAYLVRRLLENTSNEGWLRASFADAKTVEELLDNPHGKEGQPSATWVSGRPAVDKHSSVGPSAEQVHVLAKLASKQKLSPSFSDLGDGRAFINEPLRDWSDPQVRKRFQEAIGESRLPTMPQDTTEVGIARALETITASFPRWRGMAPLERSQLVVRAASLIRERRDSLCGLLVREAGKPWAEADAEVCEAIDFCEFYARAALPLFTPTRLGHYAGELNEIVHHPRGPVAVIAPWNFPLAISAGMVVAALVTGNTVVFKPAEQTPITGKVLVDLLHESGIPTDVLALVTGPGPTHGAVLVKDPRIATVAFTGSRSVGLEITAAAGLTALGQRSIKQVIAEMGGKNAIIIDQTADLDEAVLGVRQSAFGYQGQKCSACSRVIVVDPSADGSMVLSRFLDRLIGATKLLQIGDPTQPDTDLGPMISREAAERLAQTLAYVQSSDVDPQERAELVFAGTVPDALTGDPQSRYIAPHIFRNAGPACTLRTEELFGPILLAEHVNNFEQALTLANDSEYHLTGGVYSRTPSNLAKARERFMVGNLYLNRAITGALVGRQPFGGFGMSGTGSKAGGSAYLSKFVEPRVWCENTMRRGFAPELVS